MLQGEHSAILSTFIKLPFVIKIFVLSIFEWPFYTCFTVVIEMEVCSSNPRFPLSLFILMDFSIHIDTIRMDLSILYFKGSQVEISKF